MYSCCHSDPRPPPPSTVVFIYSSCAAFDHPAALISILGHSPPCFLPAAVQPLSRLFLPIVNPLLCLCYGSHAFVTPLPVNPLSSLYHCIVDCLCLSCVLVNVQQADA